MEANFTFYGKVGSVFKRALWIFWILSGGTAAASTNDQKQIFTDLLGYTQRIQNSDFGKLPSVAPTLQRIRASARTLQQRSIDRRIPSNYLLQLELDARALAIVANAVSTKNANLARPPLFQPPTVQSPPSRHPPVVPIVTRTPVRPPPTQPHFQNYPPIFKQFTVPMPAPKQPDIRLFQAFFITPRDSGSRPVAAEKRPKVFVGTVLGADQKRRLMQILDDVHSDLSSKVGFGKFTSVKIKVTTRNNLKNEISGYDVYFSPKVLFDENHQDAQFDRPSSPTDHYVPPGNYVFWARRGSAQGPIKHCSDVGRDGLTERLVDPLFIP